MTQLGDFHICLQPTVLKSPNFMNIRSSMLGVVMMSSACIAAASPSDGNELLMSCKRFLKVIDGTPQFDNDDFKSGQCIGRVSGIKATMHMYTDAEGSPNDLRACFPSGVTDGQAVRVVVKFLEDNPRILNSNSNTITMVALQSAFPCNNKSKE